VVAQAPAILEPATTVPVATQVWSLLRDDDDVPYTNIDDRLTTRTNVGLARLIRLDGMNDLVVESTVW
jgi:hypothetical protein